MKTVQRYRGMAIKQVTEKDVKAGDRQDYQLGDLEVFNEDGDSEYDSIGSMKEAKELVDGLISDRKKKSRR